MTACPALENADGVDVVFESPQVVATVSDIVCGDETLRMTINLTKPLKGKADADLALTGPESFGGTGCPRTTSRVARGTG